jgi:hypothetical protein
VVDGARCEPGDVGLHRPGRLAACGDGGRAEPVRVPTPYSNHHEASASPVRACRARGRRGAHRRRRARSRPSAAAVAPPRPGRSRPSRPRPVGRSDARGADGHPHADPPTDIALGRGVGRPHGPVDVPARAAVRLAATPLVGDPVGGDGLVVPAPRAGAERRARAHGTRDRDRRPRPVDEGGGDGVRVDRLGRGAAGRCSWPPRAAAACAPRQPARLRSSARRRPRSACTRPRRSAATRAAGWARATPSRRRASRPGCRAPSPRRPPSVATRSPGAR